MLLQLLLYLSSPTAGRGAKLLEPDGVDSERPRDAKRQGRVEMVENMDQDARKGEPYAGISTGNTKWSLEPSSLFLASRRRLLYVCSTESRTLILLCRGCSLFRLVPHAAHA